MQGDQDKVFYENLTAEESIEQGITFLIFFIAFTISILPIIHFNTIPSTIPPIFISSVELYM